MEKTPATFCKSSSGSQCTLTLTLKFDIERPGVGFVKNDDPFVGLAPILLLLFNSLWVIQLLV